MCLLIPPKSIRFIRGLTFKGTRNYGSDRTGIARSMEMEIKGGMLPPEIITEIVCRLPADSAIGCRRICKQWRSLIDHPSFVDTHTHQLISSFNHKKFGNCLIPNSSCSGLFICAQQKISSFRLQLIEYYDDNDERLVPDFKVSKPITDHPFTLSHEKCGTLMISSCNGLVFMGATRPNNDTFVCNPFTREYVNLRTSITIDEHYLRWSWRGWGGMTYGFGYLPCTNEYKVVSICYDDHSETNGHVSVYTLGSGIGWRYKGEVPYALLSIHHPPGLFANGAIHWYTYRDDDKKIVSFDLADEEFRVVVPLPPSAPSPSPNYIDELGVLGGCLCVTRSDELKRRPIPRDVWILNFNKKKEEFSWKRKFSIPWRNVFTSLAEPCAILKSGKILLCSGIGIPSYNLKTEAFYEDGSIFPTSKGLYKMIPYTTSFVSLKALGEEDANCFGVWQ